MIPVQQAFSYTYAQARTKFLQAALTAGLSIDTRLYPEKGAEGEDLAMDVVLDGAADAKSLLIISHATQGADGYAGSALQTFLLHDAEWQQKAKDAGVAVLYVHAVNPWGMSHFAFGDHENINFMRNFVDFSQELPQNAGYAQLHANAIQPAWLISEATEAATQKIVAQYGIPFLLSIYQRGQYTHEDGFYYGGTQPSWGHEQWRNILRTYAQKAQRIAWVDTRRGWGTSSGQATRIANAAPGDAAGVARAQAWWALPDHPDAVLAPDAQQTLLANGTGDPVLSFAQECPQAEFTGLAAYFAVSESLQEMSYAARSSQWLRAQAKPSAEDKARVENMMRNISYRNDESWQGPVISQGRQIVFQAVNGLARIA